MICNSVKLMDQQDKKKRGGGNKGGKFAKRQQEYHQRNNKDVQRVHAILVGKVTILTIFFVIIFQHYYSVSWFDSSSVDIYGYVNAPLSLMRCTDPEISSLYSLTPHSSSSSTRFVFSLSLSLSIPYCSPLPFPLQNI